MVCVCPSGSVHPWGTADAGLSGYVLDASLMDIFHSITDSKTPIYYKMYASLIILRTSPSYSLADPPGFPAYRAFA